MNEKTLKQFENFAAEIVKTLNGNCPTKETLVSLMKTGYFQRMIDQREEELSRYRNSDVVSR